MNITSYKFKNLIKPKMLAPAVFIGLGAYKTCKDYNKASDERKNYVLTKDSVILLSSALGYIAASTAIRHIPNFPLVDKFVSGTTKVLKKFGKTKFIKKNVTPYLRKYYKPMTQTKDFMQTSFNYLETAVKECLTAGSEALGAILAAFGGNTLISRYYLNRHKEKAVLENTSLEIKKQTLKPKKMASVEEEVINQIKNDKKPNEYMDFINNEILKDPANKVFASFSFLPVMKALDLPMTAVTGFDITKERDMMNRIKKTSYSLIANVFVPTFFISVASTMTKHLKNALRIPILALTTLIGVTIGSIAGNASEKKIEQNLKLH